MESGDEPQNPAPPALSRIKIAGSWSGILEVPLDDWTVSMLRSEVSKRSGSGRSAECVNMISSGMVLRDGEETLAELGVRRNTKVLVSFVEPAASAAVAEEERRAKKVEIDEEERTRRLARIRAVTEKMAGRHVDGSLPVEDYNIELEDQNGQKVSIGSENDQRGVMMGLMLHANAKRLMKTRKYKDALDVLAMGEEAFSLCDPKAIEMIDNVPILQIDTVWCYFMLRDVSWLTMAGIRLANARKGFERSHGKDSIRFRLLQAGQQAELAIYLRLELLEGVVAYHAGDIENSKRTLSSAQAKFRQLQVPDEALSILMGMGYKERAVKRALRMNNQDVSSAVDFLIEERSRKIRRREEDIKRRNEIIEQKRYGMTPQKKAVDILKLNELVSIGFERLLGAEALRVNENDTQMALDALTNPETNSNLQLQLERKKNLKGAEPNQVDIDRIISMGYERSAVISALRNSTTINGALSILMDMASSIETNLISTDNLASSSNNNNNSSSSAATNAEQPEDSSSGVIIPDEILQQRDFEMEDEIAGELTGDPLSDYDVEVTLEGEAIAEYLSLIESASSNVTQ